METNLVLASVGHPTPGATVLESKLNTILKPSITHKVNFDVVCRFGPLTRDAFWATGAAATGRGGGRALA